MTLQEYNDKFSLLMNLAKVFDWKEEQIDISFDKFYLTLKANTNLLGSRITINDVNKNSAHVKRLNLNFNYMVERYSVAKGNPLLSSIPDYDYEDFVIYQYSDNSTDNFPENDKLFNYNLEYDTNVTYEKLIQIKELMDVYNRPINISFDLFSSITYKG